MFSFVFTGTHSNMTTTFNKLSESVFWFGMKLDVMIYIDYCCTSENKFLLDRYFIFREHFMTEVYVDFFRLFQ